MELVGCHSGPSSSFRAHSLVLQSWPHQLQITAELGYIICYISDKKVLVVKKCFQFGLNEAIIVCSIILCNSVVVVIVAGSQSDLGLDFEWPGVYGSCQEVLLDDLNKPVHRILLICALFVFVGKGAWSRTVVLNHGFTLETKKY